MQTDSYFVTGGTGFVGRFLVEKLLARGGRVYVLTRPASLHKFTSLKGKLGASDEQLISVSGDLNQPCLGLSAEDLASLKGKIRHFFHVAAIYDLTASEEDQYAANVEGTRRAVQCAEALESGCFHHVSSTAVSGMFKGRFTENMFDEADNLSNAYFRTKHDSEAIIRRECQQPWRIYRPSGILGNSQTGEIDKIDGPYYSFPMIKKMRDLPGWLTLPGLNAGSLNLVPVDYVVDAMDHIAHKPGLDGHCFHLTNTRQYNATEVTNLFSLAAGGAQLSHRFALNPAKAPFSWILGWGFIQRIGTSLVEKNGLPVEALKMMQWDTHYDCQATQAALSDSDIRLPNLENYAATLWHYWEQHLDPERFPEQCSKA